MKQIRPMLQPMQTLLVKRKYALLLAGIILVAMLVTGFVHARKIVHIVADGKVSTVSTFHSNPAEVLDQAGIHLNNKDEFRLSATSLIDGVTIEVFRAVPVFITYQGQRNMVITGKPTVGEVIQSLNHAPSELRSVPEEATRISPGMDIRAITVKETIEEKEEVIAYPIIRQPDPMLESGLEQVQQEGQNGLKRVKYRVRYEDGQHVASAVVSEEILQPAVSALVSTGSRSTVATSRGSLRFRHAIQMEATAYLPSDGEGHGITYSGIPARHGVVAVDPRVIPLGSRVFIPGYGVAIAADTGGDIKGKRIDLCMEDSNDAWSFGRRMVKVYILAD
ncbi:MAG: hypothetical protein K0Q77_1054 [Anaerosporomusa subterranea]|jgi:uncharacterized protein YabE (DUF348 family)|nr:hypothetical protein [Anaerosporomusa subterranea]